MSAMWCLNSSSAFLSAYSILSMRSENRQFRNATLLRRDQVSPSADFRDAIQSAAADFVVLEDRVPCFGPEARLSSSITRFMRWSLVFARYIAKLPLISDF